MTLFERHELESPQFDRLRRHLMSEVDCLHRELETDQPEIQTAMRRGQIQAIKRLQAVLTAAPAQTGQ